MLIKLWITGAVIHQSVKPNEFRQSWKVSRSRYLTMLATSIIVGALSLAVVWIPFIGWIISIIVMLMFFFVLPAVVVKKMNFDSALNESYRIFARKPFHVFLMWLSNMLVSLVIIIIFLIPCMVVAWSTIAPYASQMSSTGVMMLAALSLLANIWLLAACGSIFIAGIAIVTAFNLKAVTEFYIHMKKK